LNKSAIILKAIVWLSVIALAFHILMISIYSFRENMPFAATRISDRYAVPLFHQNWKLFAPDLPKYNAELEYKVSKNGSWTDWQDASHSFGYGVTSRVETIEQGFNTSLGWQVINNFYTRDNRKQYDRIVQSPAYASALFFVLKMYQLHVDPVSPDSIQLRMQFRFTPPPKQAHNFQTSFLEFPVYVPQP